MQKPVSRILNVKDAAQYLSISRSNLYLLLEAGKIRSFKIGGRRVVDIHDLDMFIDNLKNETENIN